MVVGLKRDFALFSLFFFSFLCCFDLLSASSHCSSQISSLSHRTTDAYADSYSQRHCRFRLVVGDTIFNQYLCGSHRSIFQCPPPLLLRKVTQVQHLGATDNAKLIRVAHCSIQVGKFSGSPFGSVVCCAHRTLRCRVPQFINQVVDR